MLRTIAAVTVLAALFLVRPEPAPADTVRVMSYNIRAGAGLENVSIFGKTFFVGRGDKYLDRIADLVHELGVDVLCLQECEGRSITSLGLDQAKHIAKRLKFHHVWRQSKSVGAFVKRQGNAVVSRWPILETHDYKLNDGQDGVETRMALLCRVAVPGSGARGVWFVSTHLDHQTQKICQAQEAVLAEKLRAVTGPLVVCADFNITPDNPLLTTMLDGDFGRPMVDTVAERRDGGADELSSPASRPKRRIDYVLASKDDFTVVDSAVRIEGGKNSDHLPVMATLQLGGGKDQASGPAASGATDVRTDRDVTLLGNATAGGGGAW